MGLTKKVKKVIKKYPKFYQKTWKVVSQIPKGEVRSYSWVAKKVGSPKAARAVGQALKNNPFPGIIPCHRVIRKDGSLGGYSQGLRKKRLLLKKEKVLKDVSEKVGFSLPEIFPLRLAQSRRKFTFFAKSVKGEADRFPPIVCLCKQWGSQKSLIFS